jgi:hypothetical protein
LQYTIKYGKIINIEESENMLDLTENTRQLNEMNLKLKELGDSL